MRIGIDIDNVLSNFSQALLADYLRHDQELGGQGIVNPTAGTRQKFAWPAAVEQEYYQANIQHLVESLEPLPDCVKYLQKLRDNGHYICIITGRDNDEYTNPRQMTVDWLNKHHLVYDQLILTNAYNPDEKATACLQNQITLMVDDSTQVCAACLAKGIQPVLFTTTYNQNETRFTRVNNWRELFDYLCNYFTLAPHR